MGISRRIGKIEAMAPLEDFERHRHVGCGQPLLDLIEASQAIGKTAGNGADIAALLG